MNKLKGDCFIVYDTSILLYETNTGEYTNIPSCSGKLVFDLSRLQEGIFVYTHVKLYNKANLYIIGYELLLNRLSVFNPSLKTAQSCFNPVLVDW